MFELLARKDIDAVLVATGDHWHALASILSAKAGKDVYSEKPCGITIGDCRDLADVMNRYGRVFQAGTQRRSIGNFRFAVHLARSGKLGKIHTLHASIYKLRVDYGWLPAEPEPPRDVVDWDRWLGPAPWREHCDFGRRSCHWDWRWIMDYSGGQLTDWAGHHIDIAHWGLGLDRTGPVEIEGRGVYPSEGLYDVPIAYKLRCKYANGIEMIVANDSQQPKGRGAVWYGDKGWIQVNRGHLVAEPASILKEVIGPDELRLYESRDHKQNFLDCVKSGAETICPPEVGHRSISVALLGEIAMLTGRKLKWDPEKEEFIGDADANRYLSRSMRSPWHL